MFFFDISTYYLDVVFFVQNKPTKSEIKFV